jgi:hypothetical protein
MITLLKKLSPTRVTRLRQLFDTFNLKQASSHRLRMGENGASNQSVYFTTRWFTWRYQIRDMFKAQLPEAMVNSAMVGWFLHLPPETGFLDRMTTWVGKEAGSGTAMAYSLQDGQVIYLNDIPHQLNRGDGIGFNLSEIHEIRPSAEGQLWACVMVRGRPDRFE